MMLDFYARLMVGLFDESIADRQCGMRWMDVL